MSRWFRVHDELVDDPKIQRLPGDTVKALLNLWCLASQNDGFLPAADDIAFKLRTTPAKVAKLLSVLGEVGLIDSDEKGLRPHNWDARQFKSDVVDPTAALRQKTYRERNKNRNGGRNAPVTVTDTRTDTEADTEQKQNSDADASGAGAPIDHRKRLFDEGLKKLAAMTGKGPDACRSFVGKCLKASSDDAITVLGLIEEAERNQVVNPSAWIAARLKPVEIANGNAQVRPNSSITESLRRDLAELERSEGPDLALPASAVLRISDRSVR